MRTRRTIPIAVVLAWATGLAWSQDQAPDGTPQGTMIEQERRLEGLVARLDDPSWSVREQATRMMGDPNEGYELDMLAGVLQRGDLSVESRTRLQQAARSLFSQSIKAGLGVGFGAVRDGGVEIGTVVAEVDQFPAAGMLVPGDLIVGAEGMPLTTSEELRAMILSHEPGETLNLMIQRGDRVLDLELPLGSYTLLKGAAPISTRVADRAIELRWTRQGVSMPTMHTVGEGISGDDWIAAGYPEGLEAIAGGASRRGPRAVSAGSARSVYVGVGTVVRGRVEAWSNRNNAQEAMGTARRIELSEQMNTTRMQIQLFTAAVEMLKHEATLHREDEQIKIKLSRAMGELKAAQVKLEEQTTEFDSLRGGD